MTTKKILTDAEMRALEASAAPKKIYTDAEIAAMESGGTKPPKEAPKRQAINLGGLEFSIGNPNTEKQPITGEESVARIAKALWYPAQASLSALGSAGTNAIQYLRGKPTSLVGDLAKIATFRAPGESEYLERLGVPEGPEIARGMNARDAAGFALGILGGKVVGKGVQKVSRPIRQSATEAHLQMTPSAAKELGPEGRAAVVNEAYNSGTVGPWQTVAESAKRAAEELKSSGEFLGDVRGEASRAGVGVRASDLDAAFKRGSQSVNTASGIDVQANPALQQRLAARTTEYVKRNAPGYTGSVRPTTVIPSDRVAAMLTKLQDEAYESGGRGHSQKSQGLKSQIAAGRDADIASYPEAAQPIYKQALERYSNQADLNKILGNTEAKQGGGLMSRLGDLTTAQIIAEQMAEATPKGLILGPTAAAIRALTKGRVASTIGSVANQLGNIDASRFGKVAATASLIDLLEREKKKKALIDLQGQ